MLTLTETKDGNGVIVSDDMNPRIYAVFRQCHGCNTWVNDEEIVWATADGQLSTDVGYPWCVSCVPEQPDYP